jgi:peptide/nickel transport system ATP-binding protein
MLALLKAENVGKTYESGLIFKKRHHVLQDISLEMEEGRTLGLMGSSGSGKTTLGKILAGLERPSSGCVLFRGKDIRTLQGKEFFGFRRDVQMVFQDPEGSLNPRKTVERSIHDVLGLLDTPRGEWRKRAQEALEAVGISEELLCRYPGQISGGQNQRVALGRVLLLNPRVLILDEPTKGVDVGAKYEIYLLMKKIVEDGGSIILISSELPEVLHMSNRVNTICDGRINGEFDPTTASADEIMAKAFEFA